MKSSKAFSSRYLSKLPWWLLLLLILFIGALLLFVFIIHEVLLEKEQVLDEKIFSFLSPFSSARLTSIMVVISYCASSRFLQIAYAALIVTFLVMKNWKRAVEIAVLGAGGYVISYVLKMTFDRERPSNPLTDPLVNSSFPSGHAASAFIFYGLLVYLISKTNIPLYLKFIISSLLILFAVLIGFSRVYLRMHYPTDVVAGFSIGLAWLAISIWMMERLKEKTDDDISHG